MAWLQESIDVGIQHMADASVNKAIIGIDNGLSSDRRQAIIWTDAGILLIGPLGTNFSDIVIKIYEFSLKKIYCG